MRANSPRRERQRGIALILMTLLLMSVLLPMIGLAIDLTMLYTVRSKIQAGVDGAVLAAGRSIDGQTSLDAQRPKLQKIAQQFLEANLPQGYWRANKPTIDGSVSVTQDDATKRILISLKAHVNVPLLFLRTMRDPTTHQNYTTALVSASSTAARRFVRLVLVLDRSSSMSGSECTSMKNAARDFVKLFMPERDQLGLVVLGGSALVAYPPRNPDNPTAGNGPDLLYASSSPTMDTLISKIACGSNTGTTEGVILAYQELKKNPQPLYLNVIVLFTDGMPNGITAVFNGTTSPSVPSVIKTPGCTNYRPTDPPVKGWIAQWGGYADADKNGVGIYQTMQSTRKNTGTTDAQDVQDWLAYNGTEPQLKAAAGNGGNAANCHFLTDYTGTPAVSKEHRIGEDLSSFPVQDAYGNATNTTDYQNARIYHDNSNKPLSMTSVTNAYQIGLISWNATLNAAKTIRSDAALKPVIFCVGYNGGDAIDRSLMKRIANTDRDFATWAQDSRGQYLPTDYDRNSTTGAYYEATTAGSIQAAFQKVASEILRLTQ